MGYKKVRKELICEGCGKPILNPVSNNAKTHTSRIRGIKSVCQELRDKKNRNIFNKANRDKRKKPLNKSTEKSVMRVCLGPNCQGRKSFRSISIHQRQCNNCWNEGYDRAAVKSAY
jgi:hypothetical protein